jgi:hypothetical protein
LSAPYTLKLFETFPELFPSSLFGLIVAAMTRVPHDVNFDPTKIEMRKREIYLLPTLFERGRANGAERGLSEANCHKWPDDPDLGECVHSRSIQQVRRINGLRTTTYFDEGEDIRSVGLGEGDTTHILIQVSAQSLVRS